MLYKKSHIHLFLAFHHVILDLDVWADCLVIFSFWGIGSLLIAEYFKIVFLIVECQFKIINVSLNQRFFQKIGENADKYGVTKLEYITKSYLVNFTFLIKIK